MFFLESYRLLLEAWKPFKEILEELSCLLFWFRILIWTRYGTARIQIKIRRSAHNNGKEENVQTTTGKE